MIDVQNDVSNNQVKVELPPLSVAQVVISDQKTDTTIPVDPVIRTETKTYAFSDLELSENNYPMIPLGDKEHLKKIANGAAAAAAFALIRLLQQAVVLKYGEIKHSVIV